jgi:uncharacterized protein (TIGR02001 family)
MKTMVRGLTGLAGGLLASALMALPAAAQGSTKDAPASDARALQWSWNIGATTDYVFRGFSQSANKPAFQMGADLTYGIFYAGMWGSYIDFGSFVDIDGANKKVGGFAEVDWYMGIKPVVGPVTFDLGVILYSYPGATDGNTILSGKPYEWDYVEGKLGASGQFVKNLTTGLTLFYSPQYTNKQGGVFTLEGAVAYELPKIGVFTPTIGGTLGSQWGDFNADKFAALEPTYFQANGDNSYMYWNAGIALAVDKLTLDMRYWDTNISNVSSATGATTYCNNKTFQCDERFVFSAKVTF